MGRYIHASRASRRRLRVRYGCYWFLDRHHTRPSRTWICDSKAGREARSLSKLWNDNHLGKAAHLLLLALYHLRDGMPAHVLAGAFFLGLSHFRFFIRLLPRPSVPCCYRSYYQSAPSVPVRLGTWIRSCVRRGWRSCSSLCHWFTSIGKRYQCTSTYHHGRHRCSAILMVLLPEAQQEGYGGGLFGTRDEVVEIAEHRLRSC